MVPQVIGESWGGPRTWKDPAAGMSWKLPLTGTDTVLPPLWCYARLSPAGSQNSSDPTGPFGVCHPVRLFPLGGWVRLICPGKGKPRGC